MDRIVLLARLHIVAVFLIVLQVFVPRSTKTTLHLATMDSATKATVAPAAGTAQNARTEILPKAAAKTEDPANIAVHSLSAVSRYVLREIAQRKTRMMEALVQVAFARVVNARIHTPTAHATAHHLQGNQSSTTIVTMIPLHLVVP
jgi:hypothetical protein